MYIYCLQLISACNVHIDVYMCSGIQQENVFLLQWELCLSLCIYLLLIIATTIIIIIQVPLFIISMSLIYLITSYDISVIKIFLTIIIVLSVFHIYY